MIFNIFKEKCIICDKEELYKYNICKECFLSFKFYIGKCKKIDYIDEIFPILQYNLFLKKLVWDFKYNEKTFLYKLFGELVIDCIFTNKLHKECSIITFIPMHNSDLKKRGYNQVELITKYVNENFLMKIDKLLYKIKHTKKQASLNENERKNNLIDAFICKCNLNDQNIILIDDVLTTGATLKEAAKELKKNGAKKVISIVISSVD